MIRLVVIAVAVLAMAAPAAAQTQAADALIPADSFPDLELVADEPLSTAGSGIPEQVDDPELAAYLTDMDAWMRSWYDPESGDILSAQAVSLGTANPEAALAGAQAVVSYKDRGRDPDHDNVVLLDATSLVGQPASMALFADATHVYMLTVIGPAPTESLNRLIEEQLDRVTWPLVPQRTNLAETWQESLEDEARAARAGEIMGRIFAYAAMAGLAWWLWKRHRRKKAESEIEIG